MTLLDALAPTPPSAPGGGPPRPGPSAAGAAVSPFSGLNPQQQAAVAHGDAPLLVLAGAGTGKTLTLAARLARLVLDGADPNRVLLLTFSRRAAQALQRRAGRLLHQALGLRATQPAPELPWAGTFHAVGARLLRAHAAALGLDPAFDILDRPDAEDLLGQVRQRLGLAATRQRFPGAATALAIYSRVLNSQRPLGTVLAQDHPWCLEWHDALRGLFAAYAAEKQAQHLLDYDDLLLAWHQAMADAALGPAIAARFSHVLVDEYQDTNRLQAAILQRLRPDGRGLTVVGDDAQSIYGFRAAEVGNILGFAQQFGPASTLLALERNYRSTQPILDASNAVIARSPQRHAKTLWTTRAGGARPRLVTVADELDQAGRVADAVLARREEGLRLKQQAVLFRTGHHSAALELELTRRHIPFVKFGGLKFLEAAHVKDWLAVLRWAQNPRGRLAGWRAALLVSGFGPASARRLLDAMAAAADPLQALAAFVPPPSARADWPALATLLLRLHRAPPAWPGELAELLDWYAPQLERLHPEDAAVRRLDLEQLQRLAAAQGSRERFLTELTLDPPAATSDESGVPHRDEDYLILSTIHSAKGQEWNAVSLLNVIDGCLPADLSTGSADAVEEERRLLYVAMTRARDQLDLMVPLRFHVTQQHRLGDRHVYGGMSRFIPPSVARCFDAVVAGAPATAPEPVALPAPSVALPAPPAGRLDLGAAWR